MNLEHLKNKGVDVSKIISLLSINALLPDVIEANTIEIQDTLFRAGVYMNDDKKIIILIKKTTKKMVAAAMKQLGSEKLGKEKLESYHAEDSDAMKDLIDLCYQLDDEAIIKAKSSLKLLIKPLN